MYLEREAGADVRMSVKEKRKRNRERLMDAYKNSIHEVVRNQDVRKVKLGDDRPVYWNEDTTVYQKPTRKSRRKTSEMV